MATYEEIYGKRVKDLSADPTLDSSYEGQVWYNSTTGTLKSVVSFAAFRSSANINTTRSQVAGAGINTAGIIFGGTPPTTTAPSLTNGNKTEEFDGFTWTNQTNCPLTKRQGSAFGVQTAAAFFGGYDDPQGYEATLAEYDGSSWATGGSYPTDISNTSGGAGTLTAGWNAGGETGAPAATNAVNEYNGTSWTSATALPWTKENVNNLGPQTAGMAIGGHTPPTTNFAYYDGTNWTAQTNLPTSVSANGRAGVQTNAIVYGGFITTSYSATCLEWDGTNWATSGATLATARGNGGSCGISPSINDGFFAGGDLSETTVYNATEEFDKSINTITNAAWASGTNMPEGNYGAGSFGTQTAFVYFGGQPYPPRTNATKEYDGSTWTTTGNYTGTVNYLSGCGVESAGLGAGGFTGTATVTASAEYDGSTWTAANSMSQQRMNTGSTMVGTQPAALIVGGDKFPSTPRSLTACEEYDGTNWSTGGVYPVAVQNTAAAGTQTAGWAAGGISDTSPPTPNIVQTATNHYDGTNWTAGGSLPTATYRAGAAGTQTAGLFFGGFPPDTANTFGYDGSSWSTRPSMATARQSIGAGGVSSPSTAAIGAGGYVTPGVTNATEEFTGDTSTVTAKTLTTS